MQSRDWPHELPVPVDDGAADDLPGLALPGLTLASSQGGEFDLAVAGTLVAYVYPMTGVPGEPLPPRWMEIPGAFGCTAENCAFRDHAAQLRELGATVVGISAQDRSQQRAFAEREGIGYPLLNDSGFELQRALGLPTFESDGRRFYSRLTFIGRGGRIERVFYPVPRPEEHPGEVVAWLSAQGGSTGS